MSYAVIDTETSGLFDFAKPADAEGQPRLAHLAMILLDDQFAEKETLEMFVKPEGWAMSEDVAKINGLTNEILAEKGKPIGDVLEAYAKIVDDGYVIVAFNAQYDTKIMRGELRRAGLDDRFTRTPNICVMRALTDVCCVPKAKGNGFKLPKLSEACAHFKIEQDAAHRAMGDARSALLLLHELRKLNLLPAPTVHFAKDKP